MESTKKKIIKAKIRRSLGLSTPIVLTEPERQWIRLCKGLIRDVNNGGTYPATSGWIDKLKPMFEEIYGWSSKDDYDGFLDCIFNKLLDIHLKIKDDKSGSNVQLRDIFGASFRNSFSYNYEKPIERCIAALCNNIRWNNVIENGVNRYYL